MADTPFTIFCKDKISLHLYPKFLPKVASSFHLNQSIHLPVFYPKPHALPMEHTFHTLDVCWVLAFYLRCTRTFCTSPWLCNHCGALPWLCPLLATSLQVDLSLH